LAEIDTNWQIVPLIYSVTNKSNALLAVNLCDVSSSHYIHAKGALSEVMTRDDCRIRL
jgi:hypothetical protein